MFLALLLVTFSVALLVGFIVARLLSAPIRQIVVRVVSPDVAGRVAPLPRLRPVRRGDLAFHRGSTLSVLSAGSAGGRQNVRRRSAIGVLALAVACQDPTSAEAGARGLTVAWRAGLPPHDTNRDVFVTPTADASGAYLALPGGTLAAFRASDGALRWTAPPSTDYAASRNLVLAGGRVFRVGTVAQAVDAATGRELWHAAVGGVASFGEAAADAEAVYFGDEAHRLYALDAATGAVRWTVDVGPAWAFEGVFHGASVSGDTVYAAVQQYANASGGLSVGWVFALDRGTGRVLWSYAAGDGAGHEDVSGAPTVAGDRLLLSDKWRNAYTALDRFTGRRVWYTLGARNSGLGAMDSPRVTGATVLIASPDTYVYALRLADGAVVWASPTFTSQFGTAVCGGLVLAGKGAAYVLDLRGGMPVDRGVSNTAADRPSSPVVAVGTRAYVASARSLYAFDCPTR